MRRGQRTFRPDNKENRHTCFVKYIFRLVVSWRVSGFVVLGLNSFIFIGIPTYRPKL